MDTLGRRIWLLALSIGGSRTEAQWFRFLDQLTQTMGMNKADRPVAWHYPIEGAGGNGMTIIQPITESFLALDTWPDHNGVYLFINSCKPFDAEGIIKWIAQQGFEQIDQINGVLGLGKLSE